jgi:hypothetical protein
MLWAWSPPKESLWDIHVGKARIFLIRFLIYTYYKVVPLAKGVNLKIKFCIR